VIEGSFPYTLLDRAWKFLIFAVFVIFYTQTENWGCIYDLFYIVCNSDLLLLSQRLPSIGFVLSPYCYFRGPQKSSVTDVA